MGGSGVSWAEDGRAARAGEADVGFGMVWDRGVAVCVVIGARAAGEEASIVVGMSLGPWSPAAAMDRSAPSFTASPAPGSESCWGPLGDGTGSAIGSSAPLGIRPLDSL